MASLSAFARQAQAWIEKNIKTGMTRMALATRMAAEQPDLKRAVADLLFDAWVWKLARALRDDEHLPAYGVHPRQGEIFTDDTALIAKRTDWTPEHYAIEVRRHKHIILAHRRIIAAYRREYEAKWPDQMDLFDQSEIGQ